MKFTISATNLATALKLAAAATSRKSPMPMLACVMLRVDGAKLTICGTDTVTSVTATCAVTGGANGSAAIPADDLMRMVASVDDSIAITADDKEATIAIGKKIRARLPTLPSKDYPKMPSVAGEWQGVDASAMSSALSIAQVSACVDETRFHLCGVHLDGVNYVATDGHRMHVVTGPSVAAGAIVPLRGVAEIVRAVSDHEVCDVAIAGGFMHVRTVASLTTVKLIDAQFPPWRQVQATRDRRIATVPRADMIAALGRAKRYATTNGIAVTLADSAMSIVGKHPDRGDYSEDIELAAPWEGKPITLGLNPDYLADALRTSHDDDAVLSFGGELDPVGVFGSNASATVMPTRIG